MFATSADFPIEGRAAITIRLPSWNPPVFSSRSLNPEVVPVRRPPPRQLVDHVRPTDLVELPVLAQGLGDRQLVDLAVVLVQLEHRRKHGTVLLAVEVLGPQVLLDEKREQVPLVEQHSPQ